MHAIIPPRNKWTYAALLWLAAGLYALLFRENGSFAAPPIRHFDKIVHFFLFGLQFGLAAQAYIAAARRPPYRTLMLLALLYAAGSEAAQHYFTATRQADIRDGIADLAGAAAALYLVKLRFKLRPISASSGPSADTQS